MSQQQNRETLDVESDKAREERLGSLFSAMTKPEEGQEGPALPTERTRPHALPQSDVLARARAFLPQLAAANDELLKRAQESPESVSIENPTGQHVAMDLNLGVFDVQGAAPANVPVVEGEAWTKGEEDSSSSSSDEGSDASSDEEEEMIKEVATTKK